VIYLPDTNACTTLLRQRHQPLISRWHSNRTTDIVLCSVVVYELRYGAELAADPASEHAKLDFFFSVFTSIFFDDRCAARCAKIRRHLERAGLRIGPHDLQIAAVAVENQLTLVTHNTGEFSRIPDLKLEDWEV
jgi:tRNA(fMet)-specific endonuclease VapC